ncbi:MAG TPA: CatB-related O-acetyltransferase [Solirubrobacterales bacterium]|jgi:acetyltransferase-like isoleucine patch superfamily enzyme|nr:CatB-related O-acetyltransferase [Solirubrobacterales bacterium]
MSPVKAHKPAAIDSETAVARGVLSLGEHTYGDPAVIVYPGDTAKVRVGKYCAIADGTEFMVGANHVVDWVTAYPLRIMYDLPGAMEDGHPTTKGDITIGNDVWIGSDALILSGVTVGDGAVIGAAAVVSSDVRPYAIVAGNPAREVRRRFGGAEIEQLRRIAWWDWPDEVVKERVEELNDADLGAFLRRFGDA